MREGTIGTLGERHGGVGWDKSLENGMNSRQSADIQKIHQCSRPTSGMGERKRGPSRPNVFNQEVRDRNVLTKTVAQGVGLLRRAWTRLNTI